MHIKKSMLSYHIKQMIKSKDWDVKLDFCYKILDMPLFVLGSYEDCDFEMSIRLLLNYISSINDNELIFHLSSVIELLYYSKLSAFKTLFDEYKDSTNPVIVDICNEYYSKV